MVAGHQPAGLQRGADDPGLVVDLRHGTNDVARRRAHRRADEAHAGRVGRLERR